MWGRWQGTPRQGREEERPAVGWPKLASGRGSGERPADQAAAPQRAHPLAWTTHPLQWPISSAKPQLQVHLGFSIQRVPSSSPLRSGDSQPSSWGQAHGQCALPGRPSPQRLWRSQAATLGTVCHGGSNVSLSSNRHHATTRDDILEPLRKG